MNPTRVIGLGNILAGDDAAGILVIRKLRELNISGMDLIEAGVPGLTLLDYLENAKRALVVDAISSDQEEGTVMWLDMPQDHALITHVSWASTRSSTHAIGLGETITLGATLGMLPDHLSIVGIELGHLNINAPLSVKVEQAIEHLVATITKKVETLTCTNFTSCNTLCVW